VLSPLPRGDQRPQLRAGLPGPGCGKATSAAASARPSISALTTRAGRRRRASVVRQAAATESLARDAG
jgi:hypothetical protein